MPVTINGTTGVVGPDGSASTPSYQGTDSNTGIFFPAADTIAFATAGTEDMRIDSVGNVGIGTSAPTARLHATKNAADVARFTNSLSNGGDWEFKIGGGGFEDRKLMITDKFGGADNVRVAIDSSGNLLVGTTSAGARLRVVNSSDPGGTVIQFIEHSSNSDSLRIDANTGGSGGTGVYVMPIRTAGTLRGGIQWNGSNLLYNTSSDYRLKEAIKPMTGALARVAALKPCTYKWKETGIESEGFIAHELQQIAPQCVTGDKDAVDAEGNPVYQGIDTSFLVATLTAAIQELTARVQALEAK